MSTITVRYLLSREFCDAEFVRTGERPAEVQAVFLASTELSEQERRGVLLLVKPRGYDGPRDYLPEFVRGSGPLAGECLGEPAFYRDYLAGGEVRTALRTAVADRDAVLAAIRADAAEVEAKHDLATAAAVAAQLSEAITAAAQEKAECRRRKMDEVIAIAKNYCEIEVTAAWNAYRARADQAYARRDAAIAEAYASNLPE